MSMYSAWLGVLTLTLIVVLKVATPKCIQCGNETLCPSHMGWYVEYKVRNQRKDLECNVICVLTEMTHPIAYRAKQEDTQR